MRQPEFPVRLLALSCLAFAAMASAEGDNATAAVVAKFPEIKADQVKPTPVPGILEVRIGSKITYITADGRYLLQGDIIDLNTDENLTESRQDGIRKEVLSGVSESSMVIFAPAKYKDTVTVFTDVDCGYCRKLHKQIADYNARGIRVRYLFFPRSGPGTESWTKAEQVWCSKDQKAALTRAKLGEKTTGKICQPNPVAQQYQMGRDFGITGTPAIIMDSGELIGGYLDPDELEKYLDDARALKKGG